MDAVTLVVVFLALMVLVFVYAANVRQRPSTYREAVVRITADIEAVQRAICERLIPVIEQAAVAFREFDEAYRRAEAVMSEED